MIVQSMTNVAELTGVGQVIEKCTSPPTRKPNPHSINWWSWWNGAAVSCKLYHTVTLL